MCECVMCKEYLTQVIVNVLVKFSLKSKFFAAWAVYWIQQFSAYYSLGNQQAFAYLSLS